MSNHDHLSNIGLHPAYDPDPAIHVPVRVEALRRRITAADDAVDVMVGLQGKTVSVTIGRNIADGRGNQVAMSDPTWNAFRSRIRDLLDGLEPEFCASYDGRGVWQGVAEESTTFLASGVGNMTRVGYVRSSLEHLARHYGQDAIALTIGVTTLVES